MFDTGTMTLPATETLEVVEGWQNFYVTSLGAVWAEAGSETEQDCRAYSADWFRDVAMWIEIGGDPYLPMEFYNGLTVPLCEIFFAVPVPGMGRLSPSIAR